MERYEAEVRFRAVQDCWSAPRLFLDQAEDEGEINNIDINQTLEMQTKLLPMFI